MAGVSTGMEGHRASGSQLSGNTLSIRETDPTCKGRSTEGSGSSLAAVGDKVPEMFGRLNLTSQEANAFVLDDEEDEYPGCPEWAIVGKVLASNTMHISTIRAVLRPAWGNLKGLEFHPLGPNMFLAEFRCQADKDRIMEGSPWTVSKHGVILNDFDPSLKQIGRAHV